jgi:peptide/nickel transport system permease protein
MRYLLRRAGFYLVALWAAVTFNFIIPRLMPGDPAEAYIAKLQTQTAYCMVIWASQPRNFLRRS